MTVPLRRMVLLLASTLFVRGSVAEPSTKPVYQLDYHRPILCLVDPKGVSFRVQPLEKEHLLLYAPDAELDADGVPDGALEQVAHCAETGDFNLVTWRNKGLTPVRAIAEAPPGWVRDLRGRVFQVTFDMQKRLYGGLSWRASSLSGQSRWDRLGFDTGLEIAFTRRYSAKHQTRHRFRVLESSIHIDPFDGDLTLLKYDVSHANSKPLLRLTTFVGEPRRFDIPRRLGAYVEVGNIHQEVLRDGRSERLYRILSAQLSLDLFRSVDFVSFLRLRGGASLDTQNLVGSGDTSTMVTPVLALDGDVTLDDSGLHRLSGLAQWEAPRRGLAVFDPDDNEAVEWQSRVTFGLGYEAILVAINDQPLSLRISADAKRRTDRIDGNDDWDLGLGASLRFNLWAPPR